jgi:hypothetical protein
MVWTIRRPRHVRICISTDFLLNSQPASLVYKYKFHVSCSVRNIRVCLLHSDVTAVTHVANRTVRNSQTLCSFTYSVLRLSSLAQQCNNCWIAAERIQFSVCISFHLLVTLECFLRNDSSVVWKWIGKTFPAKLLQSVIATRTVWWWYLGEWPLSLSRAGTLHPEGFPHLLQCRTVAACFLLLWDIENAGG